MDEPKQETALPSDESSLPARDQEQIRRARKLISAAKESQDGDLQFLMLVGALHLARSIVEHWMTTVGEVIPQEVRATGQARSDLVMQLRAMVTSIFEGARRYAIVTELRNWDFHWEPLINPAALPPSTTYGRGAPLQLSTGPVPKSSATFLADPHEVVTTGSGRQVGRKNYYRIQQNRFVDFEANQLVPLSVLISEFLDDLPRCIQQVIGIPEVAAFMPPQDGPAPTKSEGSSLATAPRS